MKKNADNNEKIPVELLKKIKKIDISSRKLVNEAISGGYNSVFRGYGMEFEEVREYNPGDDYRRIDWNVTARHSIPYIKRFKEERQLNVMLLIDFSGSLEYGSKKYNKRQKLAEIASVIAFTALKNQDKIGAIFFSSVIEKYTPPSKNKNTTLRLIRDLIFLKPREKGTNINLAIDYAVENMKRRGILFILSDFYDKVEYKKLFIAAKKHDIIPVVIRDQFEKTPVNLGLVDMIDNETNELILVDTSSSSYKEFIKERNMQSELFFKELKKLNIDPMMIDTDEDIEKILVEYFKKRLKRNH
jgi:uncharacterized protein (DUF58 family)